MNSSVLFSIIGDSCEGTLISEATTPICKSVISVLKRLKIDLLTLGNHDLYYAGTVDEFLS
jgi:2',3'-cyclic-nucleotide 2'-phosphodiesterase (5'-nucleotidase family)